MASARARKLALAADTFGGRVMTIPARARTTQGAESHTLVRVNALCKHKFTEREISSAIQSSAVYRILSSWCGAPPAAGAGPCTAQLLCRRV